MPFNGAKCDQCHILGKGFCDKGKEHIKIIWGFSMGIRSFFIGGIAGAALWANQGANIAKLLSHLPTGEKTGEKTESVSVPPTCNQTTHDDLRLMLLKSRLRETMTGTWYNSEKYKNGQGLGYWDRLGETKKYVLRVIRQEIGDTKSFEDTPDHVSNLNAGVVQITAVDKQTHNGVGVLTNVDFTDGNCYKIIGETKISLSTYPENTLLTLIQKANFSTKE